MKGDVCMGEMVRRIGAVMITAIMMFGLVGCSSGGDSKGTGTGDKKDKSTLNVQICAEPASLDPAFGYGPGEFYVIPQFYDTLFDLTSDLEMVPNICESWEQPDATTYVYKIRDDVKFSDGTPMTMDDVLYCVNRIIDPEAGARVSWMFVNVKSIEQTGDWEMTIKLTQPDSLFKYTLALDPGMIYKKEAFEKDGSLVGTGPYVLDDWISGMEIDAKLNENYWKGTDDIDIKNIVFKVITDDSATVTATNSGEVDLITLLSGDYISQVGDNMVLKVVESTEDRCLFFNCKQKYTDDVNVRKALACCYDREAFMDSAYADRYEKCNGLLFGEKLFPDDSWNDFGKNFKYNYEYNIDKAKEYLKQSAYPDGGFEIVALVAANNGTEMKEAQLLQEAAKKLNITVTLKTVSDAELETVAFTGDKDSGLRDYNIYVSGWISDYPDAMGYYETLLASWTDVDGGANLSQYNNKEYDKLLLKAHEATSDSERSDILKEAANMVGEDCPIAPFGYNKSYFLIDKNYDYTFNGMDIWGLYLKNVKITK